MTAVGAALLTGLVPATASADRCAPSFVRASVSTPLAGQPAARSVHVRVDERTRCGDTLPSVDPEYRIVGPDGPLSFRRMDDPLGTHQLVPDAPLPVGSVTVEARDPISETEWGEWHALQTLDIEDRMDTQAPRLAGITDAGAEIVEGSIYISPCEAATGPVVETVLTFPLADDGSTPHDELLYTLERSGDDGASWSLFRVFRPDVPAAGQGRIDWQDEHGWDQTWSYRIAVVDASGHHTIGSSIATVVAPSRPDDAFEFPGFEEPSDESVTTLSEEDDAPPLAPAWQWGAAFFTLFGAGLAGLKGPRRR